MDDMTRYAIYYCPDNGGFASAAASWLGYDCVSGRDIAQTQLGDLPRSFADITADPRKYGFHGTIKAPFRLADGVAIGDLAQAVKLLASQCKPVAVPGLQMINLEGFLAFVPTGDSTDLNTFAAEVVRSLDPYRADLTEAEIAKRQPDRLTPRQRDLLAIYGYPFVIEEFRFHLTLSGQMTDAEHQIVAPAAGAHFKGHVPEPFLLSQICLMIENAQGRFQLLHRYGLTG